MAKKPVAPERPPGDDFIREVDEEMRREQLHELWERFGVYLIAAAVLVVLLTAGYRGFLWWNERRAAEAGDAFIAATTLADNGQTDEAIAALSEIAESGMGGYPQLARFRIAAERAGQGQAQEAIEAFDAISADPDAEEGLRSLARLRAAYLLLDAGDLDDAAERVEGLAASTGAWRFQAQEVLGTIAFSRREYAPARGVFEEIGSDASAPQSLRERAQIMISLIDGRVAPQGEAAPNEAEATN